MTKNDDPKIDMTATNARRAAYWERIAATPTVMPAIVRRPAPKARRNSVPHRSIR